jgi:hypothetical protein
MIFYAYGVLNKIPSPKVWNFVSITQKESSSSQALDFNLINLTKRNFLDTSHNSVNLLFNCNIFKNEVKGVSNVIGATVDSVCYVQHHSNSFPKSLSDGTMDQPFPITRSNDYNIRIRNDVVEKSIIRGVKNYYLADFRRFFDFTRGSLRIKCNYSKIVYEKGEEYVRKNFEGWEIPHLNVFLLALIDTKKMYVSPHREFPELKRRLKSLFYSYNSAKLERLMDKPQFWVLMLEYFNRVRRENSNRQYKEKIDFYRQWWEKSISQRRD